MALRKVVSMLSLQRRKETSRAEQLASKAVESRATPISRPALGRMAVSFSVRPQPRRSASASDTPPPQLQATHSSRKGSDAVPPPLLSPATSSRLAAPKCHWSASSLGSHTEACPSGRPERSENVPLKRLPRTWLHDSEMDGDLSPLTEQQEGSAEEVKTGDMPKSAPVPKTTSAGVWLCSRPPPQPQGTSSRERNPRPVVRTSIIRIPGVQTACISEHRRPPSAAIVPNMTLACEIIPATTHSVSPVRPRHPSKRHSCPPHAADLVARL